MKRYIPYPHVEGTASRQAHADLPAGTYEREISKEGFFGPAAHLYHKHPPTGWVAFEGPLRPHAFDFARTAAQSAPEPWAAPEMLHNNCGARAVLAERRRAHGSSRAQRGWRRAAVHPPGRRATSIAISAICASRPATTS